MFGRAAQSTPGPWFRCALCAAVGGCALVAAYFAARPYLSGPPADGAGFEAWYHAQRDDSRTALVAAGLAVLMLLAGRAERTVGRLRSFFGATCGAVNLAILRIVVFWLLFGVVSPDGLVWFARLPEILRIPPYGLAWLDNPVLFDPGVVGWTAVALRIVAIAACLGVCTRFSTITTTVLSLYLLALPHFDGKVDHGSHHLVWFALLLAASPCGDALSVDAVIRALFSADAGRRELRPSAAYGLPLRLSWLLLGILYFFPGFWKVWSCGSYWALSDNVKYLMYDKWVEVGGWAPPLRLDRYPVLYRGGALATLAFELGFIVLIFFPFGRRLAFGSGLLFHWSTAAFMRIRFTVLQWCYVVLIDWEGLFHRLGRWTFNQRLTVSYDCARLGRWVALVRVFDLLGRVDYEPVSPARQKSRGRSRFAADVAPPPAVLSVCPGGGDPIRGHRAAVRAWLLRVPLLWWLMPLTAVAPVGLFEADGSRHGGASRRVRTARKARPGPLLPRWAPAALIGGVLIVGNVHFGIRKELEVWPVSCYPTFDFVMRSPHKARVEFEFVGTDGVAVAPDYRVLGPAGSAGMQRLQSGVLAIRDPAVRDRYLRAFADVLERALPPDAAVAEMRAYRVVDTTIPELHGRHPRRAHVATVGLADFLAKPVMSLADGTTTGAAEVLPGD